MATVAFFADDNGITNLGGSGLGFYGSSFGNSVEIAAYQGTTYITDSNGVIEGPNVHNIAWTHAASGEVNGASSILLRQMTNAQASLNIRFTHGSAVKTQNAKLRIFDRSSINNPASGVTTKVAELIHPDPVQTNNGSGDATWNTPAGSSSIMDVTSSPGTSGQFTGGTTTSDTRHDFYFAISASPDSIGSKTMYGLYFELEYV